VKHAVVEVLFQLRIVQDIRVVLSQVFASS
jgi:hypothetical protein